MKIGMVLINIGMEPGPMVDFARAAEQAGVESLWTCEHVIVPEDYESQYPYSSNGKMEASPETVFVDPLIALSHVAAATSTIRLATGVNILSQANPLLMAKQVASLDYLSGGRFILGAGIGWLREEYQAMGVPFERRGARFDDYLQAMRKVWSGETVEHQSDFLSWSGFKSYPTPVQDPFPVIIGGGAGKVYQRIAKYGNGWYAIARSPEDLAPRLEELKQVCQEEGRDYDELEISVLWPLHGGLDMVRAYEDLGVHRLVVPIASLRERNPVDGLERFHQDIVSQVA